MKGGKERVKAVLLDLGGTLVKTTHIPNVMETMLKDRGINRSLEEICRAWRKAERELNFRDLARLLDEFWVQWNMKILGNLHVKSNTREIAKSIATCWWDYSDVVLYSDAQKILPLLKERGLKIGVITNGLQSDVDKILPKVNLHDFFDIVVVIDTLRKMKPDYEVFHYALQQLKTRPSNAIFVGDELEADYKGARNAGLTAYLIDRDGKFQSENVDRISSLHDLLGLGIIE